MNVKAQIKDYIAGQPQSKQKDLQELHDMILGISAKSKLWFLDGKNEAGKTVSNPNIGYGSYNITYKDGTTREFYQVGLSANTGGISVYIMGIADKTFLSSTYGKKLGKASISGYCIKFKTLTDIHLDVLKEVIRSGFKAQT